MIASDWKHFPTFVILEGSVRVYLFITTYRNAAILSYLMGTSF